jgi:hypothetical protein
MSRLIIPLFPFCQGTEKILLVIADYFSNGDETSTMWYSPPRGCWAVQSWSSLMQRHWSCHRRQGRDKPNMSDTVAFLRRSASHFLRIVNSPRLARRLLAL